MRNKCETGCEKRCDWSAEISSWVAVLPEEPRRDWKLLRDARSLDFTVIIRTRSWSLCRQRNVGAEAGTTSEVTT